MYSPSHSALPAEQLAVAPAIRDDAEDALGYEAAFPFLTSLQPADDVRTTETIN